MQPMISVSWVSFNHDPYARKKNGAYRESQDGKLRGPTLEFLFGDGSPIAKQVERHYMFARCPTKPDRGQREVDPIEYEVAQALEAEIRRQPNAPEVRIVRWETSATPIDHKALFHFTTKELGEIRRNHPEATIAVNISPGTPAAQTVLLLALQARIAGDNVVAYQSIPEDKREPGQSPLQQVSWDLYWALSRTDDEIKAVRRRGEAWSLETARSPALREVARMVKEFGGVPYPVLIIGARGTGKTSVAQDLRRAFLKWQLGRREQESDPRQNSTNKQKAESWNHHLNCAGFLGNPDIMRSTLFGYVSGAFTGASKDGEAGLLEEAKDDCVFLDEIHWLDPQAQAGLLLAVQRDGTIRRVGAAKKAIPVKFRLIAATNRSFRELREKLNPDFLDRISDLVIELPELRHCTEDLEGIWESVLMRAYEELLALDERRSQTSLDKFLTEFRRHRRLIVNALQSLRLPGNYRDLERLARRLIVAGLVNGREVSVSSEHVQRELHRLREDENTFDEPHAHAGTSLIDELPTKACCERFLREAHAKGTVFPIDSMIDNLEQRLVYAALAVAGSGAKAAELAGMRPRTFTSRLEKWKDPPL